MARLLINCDLGEWDMSHLGLLDHKIMPLIDMCNIALGGHAGTVPIIKYSIQLANKYNVKIGAHPGFEDRKNFGRKVLDMDKNDFISMIARQLDRFNSLSTQMNSIISHIKPHGALYHVICNHEKYYTQFYNYVSKNYPDQKIVCRSGSNFSKFLSVEKVSFFSESFIDRRYNNELSLVDRSKKGSVLENIETATHQYSSLVNGRIATVSNSKSIFSNTACIHSDNPNVVQILESIGKLYPR